MTFNYSAERNVQMVLALLKTYNIKKVIASPGATNVAIVSSMQQDPYFEIYSCIDERSAAYMAVGMAEECGEPIVLSCTGATSSRNYLPALTEAYYRKLPIIAITSSQDLAHVGHLIAQVTDRTDPPRDTVVDSVQIQNIRSAHDEWDCSIKLNYILQLYRSQPGPVHINLATGMGGGNNIKELPNAKVIRKYISGDILPEINSNGNIAIFVGSHINFSETETFIIDAFCEANNAVVFCDHTSSYKGKYRIMYALIGAQDKCKYDLSSIDLLIHIGEISGDYDTLRYIRPNRIWRVNQDGKFRDTFRGKLTSVFEMTEKEFFTSYSKVSTTNLEYYATCKSVYDGLISQFPELPLSNIYVAKKMAEVLPKSCVLYLGILNTLRSWNYFEVDSTIKTVSNVGGFGIDGIVSSLVGSSFVAPQKIHIGIVGDLSFFYDMNSIGNRKISSNLRLIVVNNGHGQEFEMYNHLAAFMGKDVNTYVAAQGHNGNKSPLLLKHYAEDLGFCYYSASTKEEFNDCYLKLVEESNKPIVFEVFTTNADENEALRISRNISIDSNYVIKQKFHYIGSTAKHIINNTLKKINGK